MCINNEQLVFLAHISLILCVGVLCARIRLRTKNSHSIFHVIESSAHFFICAISETVYTIPNTLLALYYFFFLFEKIMNKLTEKCTRLESFLTFVGFLFSSSICKIIAPFVTNCMMKHSYSNEYFYGRLYFSFHRQTTTIFSLSLSLPLNSSSLPSCLSLVGRVSAKYHWNWICIIVEAIWLSLE